MDEREIRNALSALIGEKAFEEVLRHASGDEKIKRLVDVRSVRFERSQNPDSDEREKPIKPKTASNTVSNLASLAAREAEITMGLEESENAVTMTATSGNTPITEPTSPQDSSSNSGPHVPAEASVQQRLGADLSTDDSPANRRKPEQKQVKATPERVENLRQGGSSSERVIRTAIVGEYIYSITALTLGLAAIIGGCVLGIYGVVGHTSFTASLLGLNTNMNDAAPGVILFVVGLFMIWATRPKIKLRDLMG
jgi:hypothetical protein